MKKKEYTEENDDQVYCWTVMCIEEKTKMNPPVFDWNWKLWTPSFIDIDIEINI